MKEVFEFHLRVRGVILQNNKLLVARSRNGKYVFLPGGHVEGNESLIYALKREFQEEANLKCKIKSYLGLIEHDYSRDNVKHFELNHIFEVDAANFPLSKVESMEPHLEFLWVETNKLEEVNLQPYPLVELIKNYAQNKSNNVWFASTVKNFIG